MKIMQYSKSVLGALCLTLSTQVMAFDTTDSDQDNMPDYWEDHYQLNPNSAVDATGDEDGDGLSNLEERLLGANPRVADTGRLPNYYFYWDNIDNEWQDFSPSPSWQLHVNASSSEQIAIQQDIQSSDVPALSGQYSLALNPDRWRFLNLFHENIKLDSWERLEFYVHGGVDGNQQLQVRFKGSTLQGKPDLTQVNVNEYIVGGRVSAGEWRKVSIPLNDLLDDTQVISYISIGWLSGFDQATTCYLDDIRLASENRNVPALHIDVDATTVVGELPAELFGVNGANWMTNIHSPDVVEHINQMGSASVRYPGGSSSNEFDWQDNNANAQEWQTTPDEFLALLADTGASGMITTNFGTGTAQLAADWAQDVLDKGADVSIWEVGNEIYGSWENSWTHDGTEYMQGDVSHDGANDFCAEIKAVDPSAQVSMVGTITPDEQNDFGSKVVEAASSCFDYYSIHYYSRGPGRRNYASLLTAPAADMPIIGENVRTLLNSHNNTQDLKIALSEYNSYYQNPENLAVQTVNMLYMADVIGQAAEQGISVANAWSLGVVPETGGGGDHYGLLQDYLDLSRQPTYYAYPLWKQSGDKRLAATTNRYASRELAVYPSLNSQNGNVTLIVINKSSQPQAGSIHINGFDAIRRVEIDTAQGDSLDAPSVTYNGTTHPPVDLAQVDGQVLPAQPDASFEHSFPAYSVSSVTVYPQIVDNSNRDSDGDGMTDAYELDNGLDIHLNDAALDADSDGLTNLDEFNLGLEANNPDTDGDGVNDYEDSRPSQPSYRGTEFGSTQINNEWSTLAFATDFDLPVVIAGPPSFNGSDPGVVRIQNVNADGFDAKFQVSFKEWDYKVEAGQDAHVFETIPHLVLEQGRQTKSDGSEWEVGTFQQGGTQQFQQHLFSQSFAGKPKLFLTIQTAQGEEVVTVRAKNVTQSGFKAALFEQESLMGNHAVETIGYLAVYSPNGSGVVNIGGKNVPYVLQDIKTDHNWSVALNTQIKVEEEQSKDQETWHKKEEINLLSLAGDVFAQDVSTRGRNTAALRQRPQTHTGPLEWGLVSGITDRWTTVPLKKHYEDPVVVAVHGKRNGPHFGVAQVANVTADSFQVKFKEWNYLDGTHPSEETVHYFVVEAGETSLAGLRVQAGTTQVASTYPDTEVVEYPDVFNNSTALFVGLMTDNGIDTAVVRVQGKTSAGFQMGLQEQERNSGSHERETVGWIAIETGSGTAGDRRIQVSKTETSQVGKKVPFSQTRKVQMPIVVQSLMTSHGGDTALAEQASLTGKSVSVKVMEEKSSDNELKHTIESIGLFIAE